MGLVVAAGQSRLRALHVGAATLLRRDEGRTLSRQTKRSLRAFPRSTCSSYETELTALIEARHGEDDWRKSDRVDLRGSGPERGRACASAGGRPSGLSTTAGVVVAASCVAGGLVVSNVFSSPLTSRRATPRATVVNRIHASVRITACARALTCEVTQVPTSSWSTAATVFARMRVQGPTEEMFVVAGPGR